MQTLTRVELGDLADGIADLHEIFYEARPAISDVRVAGAVLSCVLEGGLTPSDEMLLRAGRDENLREFREEFVDAIRAELTTLVEVLSGQEVASFARAFEPGRLHTTLVFVLREPNLALTA